MQVNVHVDRVVVRDHGGALICADALGQALAENLSDAMTGVANGASRLGMRAGGEASSSRHESVSGQLASAIFANFSGYGIGLTAQHGGRS
jgi:hypothetical protein